MRTLRQKVRRKCIPLNRNTVDKLTTRAKVATARQNCIVSPLQERENGDRSFEIRHLFLS